MGLREYARHRAAAGLPGTTHHAVQEAIGAGRLLASLTRDKKRIRSAKAADAEWAASTNEDRVPLTGPAARANGTSSPGPSDLVAARTRREQALAELAELDLAERKGELVKASDVAERFVEVVTAAKTKLLGLPTRVKQRLPHLSSEDVKTIDDLVREALESLASAD